MEGKKYVVVLEVTGGTYPNFVHSRTEVAWGDEYDLMEDCAAGIVAGTVARAKAENGVDLIAAADVYEVEEGVDYTDPGAASGGVHIEDLTDIAAIWLP